MYLELILFITAFISAFIEMNIAANAEAVAKNMGYPSSLGMFQVVGCN